MIDRFHTPRRIALLAVVPALLLAVALLRTGLAGAQEQPDPQQPAQLQPGELLKISVLGFGGPEVESWFVRRLNQHGRLDLPVVGEIDASGASRFQLETKIADAYNRSAFRNRPIIAIISRLDHGEDHVLIPAFDAAVRRDAARGGPVGQAGDENPAREANVLARPLPAAIALEDVSLEEAVVMLAKAAEAEVFVNWEELDRHGVSRETPVDLNATKGMPLATAMGFIAKSAGDASKDKARLDFTVDDGVVILSTREDLRQDTETVVMDIRGLIGLPNDRPEVQAEQVIAMIMDTVEPGAWKDNGGAVGAISELNGQLVVTATPEMLAEVRKLLEKLEGK